MNPVREPATATARACARTRPPRRADAGFSLVEMLIVLIIIAILAAMVLGLIKIVGSWQAKAQTHERLGKVRAAIEEFYAEYGKYPPVDANAYGGQPFYYEYPISNGMNSIAYPMFADPTTPWSSRPVFTFGLMSFLVRRSGEGRAVDILTCPDVNFRWPNLKALDQWHLHNNHEPDPGDECLGDQQRDLNAIRRWSTYLEDITDLHTVSHDLGGGRGYTNACLTVLDGWGNQLNYESKPPYKTYRLWSDGAPGENKPISTGPGH